MTRRQPEAPVQDERLFAVWSRTSLFKRLLIFATLLLAACTSNATLAAQPTAPPVATAHVPLPTPSPATTPAAQPGRNRDACGQSDSDCTGRRDPRTRAAR